MVVNDYDDDEEDYAVIERLHVSDVFPLIEKLHADEVFPLTERLHVGDVFALTEKLHVGEFFALTETSSNVGEDFAPVLHSSSFSRNFSFPRFFTCASLVEWWAQPLQFQKLAFDAARCSQHDVWNGSKTCWPPPTTLHFVFLLASLSKNKEKASLRNYF